MGSDFIHFLLILYLIYLSDCFVFARASEVVLYARMRGSGWRVKSTEAVATVAGRFWLLRPLLLPLGSSYRLPLPRCALGRRGFCSASPISRSARMGDEVRYLDYDAVEAVEVRDGELRVNGILWFQGMRHEVLAIRSAIEAVAGAEDRPAAVRRWIEAQYREGAAAGEALDGLESRTRALNLFCSVYAVWLLLYLPLGVVLLPPMRLLWSGVVPMLVLHCICGILFLRAHAKLLPAERYARWETFTKMFLCPPMMLRACDPVCDQAGVGGDPMAGLMAITKEKQWRTEVMRVWRRLIPGRHALQAPEVADALNEYAAVYRDVMGRALKDRGVDPVSLEVDAARIPEDQRFCPCCGTVYRAEVADCSDCGEVPLLKGKEPVNVS